MTDLAGNPNLATVQFNDGFRNGQPHTGARNDHALLPATIELFKDHLLFHGINSGSVIGNAGNHLAVFQLGSDMDGGIRGRIFCRIIHEMGDHFCDSVDIHVHRREVRGNTDFDGVALQSGL